MTTYQLHLHKKRFCHVLSLLYVVGQNMCSIPKTIQNNTFLIPSTGVSNSPVPLCCSRNNKDKPVAVTTTTTTTTAAPSTTTTTTTEAILIPEADQQQYDAGNEVPAEDAAATSTPEDVAVEESQPDNSVITETPLPPATDAPAVPSRARGKFLEQPVGGPGLGWGWPANIKLEIPVPRRVSTGIASVGQ